MLAPLGVWLRRPRGYERVGVEQGRGAKETAWKLKLLHCFTKEKEFLEIVSSIENTAEQWDGWGEGAATALY